MKNLKRNQYTLLASCGLEETMVSQLNNYFCSNSCEFDLKTGVIKSCNGIKDKYLVIFKVLNKKGRFHFIRLKD